MVMTKVMMKAVIILVLVPMVKMMPIILIKEIIAKVGMLIFAIIMVVVIMMK